MHSTLVADGPSAAHTGPRPDFTEYVGARRQALLRMAQALTGDPHSAEDLLQSALAKVYLSWDRIRDPRAADAYVHRTMVNQHASWWRRRWRSAEWSTDRIPESAEPYGSSAGRGGLDATERDRLWTMVQGLPLKQRNAVVLRYYEELSEAEAARVLRCSVGTVKSNTSRGLATMRTQVAR